MRIRWKLLILLLAISLVPLAIAVWIGQDAAAGLGDDLAADARAWLTEDAEHILLQTVRDQSRLLARESEIAEYNLRIQAREVERCLAAAEPAVAEIHFADEFESETGLPGLVSSEQHARATADGSMVPMRISYKHQNFVLAPGVKRAEVADDLARLAPLSATYRLVHTSQAGLMHWQYTALASGVHSSYPGHGHYPAGYDARQRPWYRNAQQRQELTWNPPTVDAPTRQVMLSASMPVRWPDGSFAGVTGIDIRITDLVGTVELPPEWARAAQTMIVTPRAPEENARRAIHIIAHQDYRTGAEWDVPLDIRLLTSSDEAQFDELSEDLAAGRAGVRTMPYEARNSLWAYGPLRNTASALLVIVPREDVLAPALAAADKVRDRMSAHRALMFAIAGGVIVAVCVLSVFASRHVTRPVQELAAAARRIAGGDLDTPTRITTRDELGQLGATVNAMLPQLRERLRIKQALAVAMEVQQSLLPQRPPRVAGLDIAGRSIYCDETGGDYYDFVDLSDISPQRFGVAVGDVTGHGIAAALLMATARALLRSQAGEPCSLSTVLNRMNRHLSADTPADKFMTLCYLLFDTQAGTVCWASAGHDPAIVYCPATDSFTELAGAGLVLGVDPNWRYQDFGPQKLEPGQVIVIGTDGVWEAHRGPDQMFGKDRVREIVRAKREGSAAEISKAITDAVAAFRGDHLQDDDITLVVVKVDPRQPGPAEA